MSDFDSLSDKSAPGITVSVDEMWAALAETLRIYAVRPETVGRALLCDAADEIDRLRNECDRLRAWMAWMAAYDEHARRALNGDPAPNP